jgi:carboxymethylenebutenolidase
MSFIPPLRKQAEEAFSARKDKENFVEYEFKDYKGQRNLFTQGHQAT